MTKLNKLFESKNSALIFKSKNTKKKQENRKENKKLCVTYEESWEHGSIWDFMVLVASWEVLR